jgi:hypothetical protein
MSTTPGGRQAVGDAQYANENHSAQEKPNQIDYHRRILQWFGHYLKGEDAPAWIAKGVTVIDSERASKTR